MKRALTTAALAVLLVLVGAPTALASPQRAVPDILDCNSAPTPEVPGRGVVGFFESPPKTPPPAGDPFAAEPTTSIYEQYGYAGLRFNTYDLGCGPDVARNPDAVIGTSVANWILTFPKAAVAATGATVTAAFSPTFLGVFDPLITKVVEVMRRNVFEQWAFVVIAALGLFIVWRSRSQAMASTASAIAWALLVMVLVTMVGRWPVVAGHAADQTVTATVGAVTGGLNGRAPGATTNAGTEATAGMHEALLYQSWLGGTFGDTNSDTATKYGPIIFDATALTWAEAKTLHDDPDAGKVIIEAKSEKFKNAAAQIKDADPDAYEYLTGRKSDTRVGYAILAGLATLCAVPFLFIAALLMIGALIIVRFGVMLFPGFATLGLFPTMRHLVTGIGSTVAAALINAIVFGIGAAVTVVGLGVLTAPSTGTPPWLDIILMLLLTIVMWVTLRPFRRLTQMVGRRNHFEDAVTAPGGALRSAGRGVRNLAGTVIAGATAGGAAGLVLDHADQADPAQVPRPPSRPEGNPTAQLTAGPTTPAASQPAATQPTTAPALPAGDGPALAPRFETSGTPVYSLTTVGATTPDMADLERMLRTEASA